MITSRRAAATIGVLLAAAIIFSPLLAALVGTGLDRAALAEALAAAPTPLARSLAVAAIAAAVALLLGMPFAIAVEAAGKHTRRLLWALGLLTLIMPPYIVAESAIVTMGPAGKLSRGLALLLGLGPPASDTLARARYAVPPFVYTVPAAGCALGGCLFAIVALAVAGALRRTDRRMFEAARLARGRAGVITIAARLLFPPAIGAALLVAAAALTELVLPQLLRVQTIGQAINDYIEEGDVSTAAALGLTLLPLIILAGAAGAFILLKTRSASLAGLEGEVPDFRSPAGKPMLNALAAGVAAIAIFPALLIPATALTWLTLAAKLPPPTPGAHQVLRASGFINALAGAWELAHGDAIRTMVLAAITATIAAVAATLLAWSLARSRWAAMLGVLGAGLAIPAPIVGLGLITIWNRTGPALLIYNSPTMIALAWLARFAPVTILLAQAALTRVPKELEDAAALAGRSPLQQLTSVVLPAAAPGLAAAWLATYVLCATEFVATLLVSPPGFPLLAPSVVNLMRRGPDPEIAAVQVLLLAVVAAPLVLLALLALARAWRKGITR